MNLAAARIARQAADAMSTPDHPRFVAGALGPTPRTASISPDVNDPGARNVSFDELRAAYREQAEALLEGGCDLFLVEAHLQTRNAKAADLCVRTNDGRHRRTAARHHLRHRHRRFGAHPQGGQDGSRLLAQRAARPAPGLA